jgi:hypothetical protein
MNLYHFTPPEYLPSIASSGLDSGMVFVTPFHYVEGVWLTTNALPYGHGLGTVSQKQRIRISVSMDVHDTSQPK